MVKNYLAEYIPSYMDDMDVNPMSFDYEDNDFSDMIFNTYVENSDKEESKIPYSNNDNEKKIEEPDYLKKWKEEFKNNVSLINENKKRINKFDSSIEIPKGTKSEDSFNMAFDEYEKINPNAKKYRDFLKKVAFYESRFDSKAKNPNAPAYGYFQFMQDGKRYNNISAYSGKSINEFMNNPVIQIDSAVKMINDIDKQLTDNDIKRMNELGISKEGAYGIAWLSGVGGLRKFIHKGINSSDKSWYKDGKGGVDVIEQIKRYN